MRAFTSGLRAAQKRQQQMQRITTPPLLLEFLNFIRQPRFLVFCLVLVFLSQNGCPESQEKITSSQGFGGLEASPTLSDNDVVTLDNDVVTLFPSDPPTTPESISKGKIGFMFLTYGDVKAKQRWAGFFQGIDASRYRILVHAKNPEMVTSALFADNLVADPIPTSWGNFSLVEATLLMMEEMLEDQDVQYLVLLSDSCVPLRDFDTTAAALSKYPTRFTYHSPYLAKNGCPRDVAMAVRDNALRLGLKLRETECVKHQQFFAMHRSDASVVTSAATKYASMKKMQWADEGYFANVLLAENRTNIRFDRFEDKPGEDKTVVWYRHSVNCEVRTKWIAHPWGLTEDELGEFQRNSECLFLRKVKPE